MRYDIEADWHLLNTCNYRCSYCFFPPDVLGSKLRLFATPQQWRNGFDTAGVTWLVHITGGEPSIYPDFVDLCEELCQALCLPQFQFDPSLPENVRRED